MRESESCLMEHLAKLYLLHGARNTFHQNNPLGSAMNVMDVSIIAAETAFAPKELNILWLCLCIAHLSNYKTESIRQPLKVQKNGLPKLREGQGCFWMGGVGTVPWKRLHFSSFIHATLIC